MSCDRDKLAAALDRIERMHFDWVNTDAVILREGRALLADTDPDRLDALEYCAAVLRELNNLGAPAVGFTTEEALARLDAAGKGEG